MSDVTRSDLALPAEKPPAATLGAIGWLRANLFNSIPNTILTLFAAFVIVKLVPPFIAWLVIDSSWTAPNAKACRDAGGACWAFIGEWYRFMLFGRFPYAEQWRPLLVIVIFIAMFLASCDRRLWGRPLIVAWLAGGVLVLLLMFGGVFGMTYVETALWNGLPLTLILAVFGVLLAFPLAIVLALGRRSQMPVVHSLSVAYIELIRGVPLITILFMASVMLPLFLPTGTTIDKLLRAQIAVILFAADYLARKMRLVILPQALTMVIPPLVNTFIGTFKDTSLVIIIGLLDLLGAANNSLNDANWRGFYWEAYIFIGAIYWCFCFFMSKYSQYLERDLNKARRR